MGRTAPTFEQIRDEYTNLFAEAKILTRWAEQANHAAQAIIDAFPILEEVEKITGVPKQIIGVLQMMEAGVHQAPNGVWKLNFSGHLHNGDPLTARTVQVPKGRPVAGRPPFSWKESAIDAIKYDGLDKVDWTDAPTEQFLYRAEGYNGWGYRMYHANVLTPYLWSGTTHYTRGKYVKDGPKGWSETAVSGQIGIVPVMKRMEELGQWIKPAQPEAAAEETTSVPRIGGVCWPEAHVSRDETIKPKDLVAEGSRSMTIFQWLQWKVGTLFAGWSGYEVLKAVTDGKDTATDVLEIVERHFGTIVGLVLLSTLVMVIFGKFYLAEAARDGRYDPRKADGDADTSVA